MTVVPPAPPAAAEQAAGPDARRARTGGEVPTHRRTIEFEVFEREEGFCVVGRLRDQRPWAAGTDLVEHVHDMELEITVRRDDLTITAVRAEMARFPHHECREIEGAFQGLIGLSVARGYTRAVQERFGRTLGCAHLELLARMAAPVVIQAIPSSALRHRGTEQAASLLAGAGGSWLSDTCHVWRGGGPGPQKLALGWRPGTSYPAPPLAVLQQQVASDAAAQERTAGPGTPRTP